MRQQLAGSALQQQGAALVGVLALLSVSLLVGVSGMQTALIDERMAGNYRQATQIEMTAEWAVALALAPDALDTADFIDAPVGRLDDVRWQHLRADNSVAGHCPGDYHCRYGYWLQGGAPYIVAMAWEEREGAVLLASLPIVVALELTDESVPGEQGAASPYRLAGWR